MSIFSICGFHENLKDYDNLRTFSCWVIIAYSTSGFIWWQNISKSSSWRSETISFINAFAVFNSLMCLA